MPIDRSLYPPDWDSISYRIRSERAHWKCEWCEAKQGHPHPVTGSRVVLTVAHLGVNKPDGTPGNKNDKMDCREENLAALCQRCHLNYDRNEILEVQMRNRFIKAQRQREAAKQLPLFDLPVDYD